MSYRTDQELAQRGTTMSMSSPENSLKLLHPFIPFVTEEIWSMLPTENKKLLIVESWPKT